MIKRSAASAILMAVVVSVLLAALAAARQDQNTNQNSNMNRNGNVNSNRSGQDSSTVGGTQNSNGAMLDSSDRKFMTEAGTGGMAEVEWARLALQRASSDAVKQYAQQMIDDHTKANQTLTQLASTKGVTLQTALDNKHANVTAKLQRLSGADFDRTYIKEAGVKAHENMEKLFMREADRGKDADAKSFASATLPTVQEHLRMARGLMGGMTGNKNTSTSGGNTNTSGNMNTSGNTNTSGNSNMSNANDNTSGNTNTSNVNDNSNMSGNSNMSNANGNSNASNANDNTSGNTNTSGNSNASNANGNSNTPNANGNSNNPR
jgi:putative membrane protein